MDKVCGELRRGYTTGACAAAAARAASLALWENKIVHEITLNLPGGRKATLPVKTRKEPTWAEAEVIKDAGDDPDVTNGAAIRVTARRRDLPGIVLKRGEGVGLVTLPGLAVPPGEPAINPIPRQMIMEAVNEIISSSEGVELIISIPGGEEIARKTLNPRLGIIGGLSILGTTGIVEPMSEEAFRVSLVTQVDVAVSTGLKVLVITPGRTGQRIAEERFGVPARAVALSSNFIGFMLEACAKRGIRKVLLWGHAGKIIKIAGGIFYTHSRIADCRREIVVAWAAAAGAPKKVVDELLAAVTVEEMYPIIEKAGIGAGFWDRLAARASKRAEEYLYHEIQVGTAILNLRGEITGWDQAAREIMEELTDG